MSPVIGSNAGCDDSISTQEIFGRWPNQVKGIICRPRRGGRSSPVASLGYLTAIRMRPRWALLSPFIPTLSGPNPADRMTTMRRGTLIILIGFTHWHHRRNLRRRDALSLSERDRVTTSSMPNHGPAATATAAAEHFGPCHSIPCRDKRFELIGGLAGSSTTATTCPMLSAGDGAPCLSVLGAPDTSWIPRFDGRAPPTWRMPRLRTGLAVGMA